MCAGLSSPLFCNVSSLKSTTGPELDLRGLRLVILCHKALEKDGTEQIQNLHESV